jgi:hypothetical protein
LRRNCLLQRVIEGKIKGGIEGIFDKTKYIVWYRDYNAGRSHCIKTDNSSFELVEEFQYLGTTLTNGIYMRTEIKSSSKSGHHQTI